LAHINNTSIMIKNKQVMSNITLIFAAFIWGTAFVAQSKGMDYVGPLTFLAVRASIGAAVLIPVILINDRLSGKQLSVFGSKDKLTIKTLVIGGLCAGVALFGGSSLQQIGISMGVSIGKAGFITSLYMVFVPVFGMVVGKRTSFNQWIAVAIALVGMYLLSVNSQFTISIGELTMLGSAVIYAIHILTLDYLSKRVECIRLSCIQWLVTAIISTIGMFIFEQPNIQHINDAIWSILYLGVLSSGVAFTLQVIAQKNLNPTVATLIMCLESVFALLSGYLILHEILLPKELLGCALVLVSVVLAQLPITYWISRRRIRVINNTNVKRDSSNPDNDTDK